MTTNNNSRYRAVSRRRFLQASALGGVVAMVPGLACSSDSTSGTPATTGPATQSTASDNTEPSTSQSAAEAETLTGTLAGEMVVSFSYIASDSGRVHSPYIAVWVEDAAGTLVRTISLWYKSDERDYLSDLRRWSDADGRGGDAVLSGATRAPGSYTVSWNATTADGSPVPVGDYHLCIEAAREDGPYELIRQPLSLDGSAFSAALPDDGELTNAIVEFNV